MQWVKAISRRDAREAWRDDFPLSRDLPDQIVLDLTAVDEPPHPMMLLRLQTFIDWHKDHGKTVQVELPASGPGRERLDALRLDHPAAPDRFVGHESQIRDPHAIVPITRLRDHTAVEEVARATKEVVEYGLRDVAMLGDAAYMAVSELCGNAMEHGENPLGAYVVVVRDTVPRRRVTIAVADLGIGIPEHLRRQFPEYSADDHAIALAMEPRVTGTGSAHRGNGFSETFEAALTSTLHAARIEIHSAKGFVRKEIVQERGKTQMFPGAQYRRGTWIVYELVTAGA